MEDRHDQELPIDYRRLVEKSLDLLCVARVDGYFHWLSPQWETQLGWTRQELMSRPFVDFVHPDDVEATLAEVGTLSRGVPTLHFSNRYRHREGSWRWLEWVARPDPDGNLYASARDVTRLRESAADSRRQLELLRLAEEIGQIGHWRVQLDQEQIYWSDQVYRIHGRDPESFTPTLSSGIEAYHPDDRERVSECVQRAIKQQEMFDFQLRLIRADGEERLVHSMGRPEVDARGKVIALFGVFQDITERHRELLRRNEELAERALLQERTEQLRREATRNAERFRAIFESAPVMIESIAPDGERLLWNRECARQLGYTREEINRVEDPIAVLHPDVEAQRAIRKAIEDGDETFREHEVLVKSGEVRSQRWANFVLADGERIGVGYDLTELRRSYAELERFAYAASHDLQAPLRTVLGLGELLREEIGEDLSKDAREYLDRILRSSVRMQRLVEGLLHFAGTVGSHAEFERVDLGPLVRGVVDSMESNIREAGAIVSVDALPQVFGREVHLESVFQNMLMNAIRYRSADRTPKVHVSASEIEEHWRIAVRDNGRGFDMAHSQKVFELFRRLEIPVEGEGERPLGLGLSLCKRIVESHGGTMGVESEVGVGTTFWFSLPNRSSGLPQSALQGPRSVHDGGA